MDTNPFFPHNLLRTVQIKITNEMKAIDHETKINLQINSLMFDLKIVWKQCIRWQSNTNSDWKWDWEAYYYHCINLRQVHNPSFITNFKMTILNKNNIMHTQHTYCTCAHKHMHATHILQAIICKTCWKYYTFLLIFVSNHIIPLTNSSKMYIKCSSLYTP